MCQYDLQSNWDSHVCWRDNSDCHVTHLWRERNKASPLFMQVIK
jgi:hypothetical protein